MNQKGHSDMAAFFYLLLAVLAVVGLIEVGLITLFIVSLTKHWHWLIATITGLVLIVWTVVWGKYLLL